MQDDHTGMTRQQVDHVRVKRRIPDVINNTGEFRRMLFKPGNVLDMERLSLWTEKNFWLVRNHSDVIYRTEFRQKVSQVVCDARLLRRQR